MARLPITLTDLPDTLSQRVQYLRDHLDMTQRQLAYKASLEESFIQDIESGMEMFLAPAIRLKLARALRVKPSIIQEVEKRPQPKEPVTESAAWQKERRTKQLLEQILQEPDGSYACLECQSGLIVRQFERRDLDDNLLLTIKIECSHCLFRWSTD